MREIPWLNLGGFHLDLRFGRLLAFGKALARRRVEQRLRVQIGAAVSRAFSSYARLLRAWAMSTLEEMQCWFNAHTDGYRAQLEQQSEGGEISEPDAVRMRADLDLLAYWPGG